MSKPSVNGCVARSTHTWVSMSPVTGKLLTTTFMRRGKSISTGTGFGTNLADRTLLILLLRSQRHSLWETTSRNGNLQILQHLPMHFWTLEVQRDVTTGLRMKRNICPFLQSNTCTPWRYDGFKLQLFRRFFLLEGKSTSPNQKKINQGIIDAADMRPITVFSIFWRAYATAWTKTPEFQQFAQRLPQEVAGLHQHEGAEEAASVLQQHLCLEKGTLITLDYSQCYDRMDVLASTLFLNNIQWPAALVSQMRQVWQTQRFLEFDGHVHPTLLQSSGVPQGCPLAPLTLACWMSSGIAAVNHLMQTQGGYSAAEAARAKVRVYMDDRSWVDSDYQRCLSRADQWLTWSTAVGLRENVHKAQACSKLKRQHAQLRIDRPDWFRDEAVTVLGVSIRPRPMANTELEQTRLKAAIQRAKLLSCLPVSYQKKIEIYRIFCLPKVLFGWVSRSPPCKDSNLLFNSLSKMTGTNRVASPILRSVLYGGSVHLHVLVATRLFKRLCRMKQRNTASWSNAFGTPTCALRRWLRDFGWSEAGQWKWNKDGESLQAPSHTEVDRQTHQMRMSWRLKLLRKFAGHSRHEAAEWRRSSTPLQMHEEINQVNLEAARTSFQTADVNGRAILLGSTVSPAYLGMARGTDTSCPWCGKLGTFMHLAWHCKALPDANQRPSMPTSWLERRLAWPQHNTSISRHKRVLQWLAHVQQQVLLARHGSARA